MKRSNPCLEPLRSNLARTMSLRADRASTRRGPIQSRRPTERTPPTHAQGGCGGLAAGRSPAETEPNHGPTAPLFCSPVPLALLPRAITCVVCGDPHPCAASGCHF
eukprot:7390998-Prymnesium_polylepis.2